MPAYNFNGVTAVKVANGLPPAATPPAAFTPDAATDAALTALIKDVIDTNGATPTKPLVSLTIRADQSITFTGLAVDSSAEPAIGFVRAGALMGETGLASLGYQPGVLPAWQANQWAPPPDLQPGTYSLMCGMWNDPLSVGVQIGTLTVTAVPVMPVPQVGVDKVMWNNMQVWPVAKKLVGRIITFDGGSEGPAILMMTGRPVVPVNHGIASGIPRNVPGFAGSEMEAALHAAEAAGDAFWRMGYISTKDDPWVGWGSATNNFVTTESFDKMQGIFNYLLADTNPDAHVGADSDWTVGKEYPLTAGTFVPAHGPQQIMGWTLPAAQKAEFQQDCVKYGTAMDPDDVTTYQIFVWFYRKVLVT